MVPSSPASGFGGRLEGPPPCRSEHAPGTVACLCRRSAAARVESSSIVARRCCRARSAMRYPPAGCRHSSAVGSRSRSPRAAHLEYGPTRQARGIAAVNAHPTSRGELLATSKTNRSAGRDGRHADGAGVGGKPKAWSAWSARPMERPLGPTRVEVDVSTSTCACPRRASPARSCAPRARTVGRWSVRADGYDEIGSARPRRRDRGRAL